MVRLQLLSVMAMNNHHEEKIVDCICFLLLVFNFYSIGKAFDSANEFLLYSEIHFEIRFESAFEIE